MGTPRENTEPKKTDRAYSGDTSVIPATASAPMTDPAMRESDISRTDATTMVSVPPNSME